MSTAALSSPQAGPISPPAAPSSPLAAPSSPPAAPSSPLAAPSSPPAAPSSPPAAPSLPSAGPSSPPDGPSSPPAGPNSSPPASPNLRASMRPRKASISEKMGSSIRNLLKPRNNSNIESGKLPASPALTSEAAPIDEGTQVWIADAKHEFLPARTTARCVRGQPVSVFVPQSGQTVELTGEQTQNLTIVRDDVAVAVSDMIALNDLNEPMLLHNLRLRFQDKHIYTAVDSILVSINPYERLHVLYDDKSVALYRREADRRLAGEEADSTLPPHVYNVANRSFVDLVLHGRDQSCIISGESGAGKTEATKIFLSYILGLSATDSHPSTDSPFAHDSDVALEQRILSTNPVLEALGNARTERNDNSSRFGKLIGLTFSQTGVARPEVTQCNLTTYLLEKTRVVTQSSVERNYHIFYQLLAAREFDPVLKEILPSDMTAADFAYLNPEVITIPGVDDAQEWTETSAALDKLVSADEREQLVHVLAGVLFLGNIKFMPSDPEAIESPCVVSNPETIATAAMHLGVDTEDLTNFLTTKLTVTPREVLKSPYSAVQASVARDALSKIVYSYVFDWVVSAANKMLTLESAQSAVAIASSRHLPIQSTSSAETSFLAVLDIYGFECMNNNGLEQICINFCNEKLHSFFCRLVVNLELEEYKSQGVDTVAEIADVLSGDSTIDNSNVLTVLEGSMKEKVVGIMGLTDDEVKGTRDDGRLADRINDLLHDRSGKSKRRKVIKHDATRFMFTVNHFAGPVEYSARGFVDKNSDKAPEGIFDCFSKSSRSLLAGLAGAAATGQRNGNANGGRKPSRRTGSIANRSLLSKLRSNFDELNRQLSRTEPHFVRCVKPNKIKAPMFFDASMVLTQVRYSGVSEVCRIRKHGFPNRIPFDEFAIRYPIVLGETSTLEPEAARDLCTQLAAAGILQDKKWLVGKSKVFLKTDQMDRLEAARYGVVKRIVLLQSVARAAACKSRYASYKLVANSLKKGSQAKKLDLLESALGAWDQFIELYPNFPVSTILYTNATALRIKLRDCEKLSAAFLGCFNAAHEASEAPYEERQPIADELETSLLALEPLTDFLSSKSRAAKANSVLLLEVLRTKPPPTPPPTPPPSPPPTPPLVPVVPPPPEGDAEVNPVDDTDSRIEEQPQIVTSKSTRTLNIENGVTSGVAMKASMDSTAPARPPMLSYNSTAVSNDTDRVQEELELLRGALQRKLDTIEVRLRETEHVIQQHPSESAKQRPMSSRQFNAANPGSSAQLLPPPKSESSGGCCVVM